MEDDQNAKNATPFMAVFLGGPLHGTVAPLLAPGTPKFAVGMEKTVSGYRLQSLPLPRAGKGDLRYFYIADDLLREDITAGIEAFWSSASIVPIK